MSQGIGDTIVCGSPNANVYILKDVKRCERGVAMCLWRH